MKSLFRCITIFWITLAVWNAVFIGLASIGYHIIYSSIDTVSVFALCITSIALLSFMVYQKRNAGFGLLLIILLTLATIIIQLISPPGKNTSLEISGSKTGKNSVVVFETSSFDAYCYSANPAILGILYKEYEGPLVRRDAPSRCEDIEVIWEGEHLTKVYIIYDKKQGRNESEMIPVIFKK